MTTLVGGASTQSRGRRPLPHDAVKAIVQQVEGSYERVHFFREDGTWYSKRLLSWIGGQWGGLWGSGYESLPHEIRAAVDLYLAQSHGSFGHRAEYDLADALGEVYAPYINGSGDLGCRFFANGGDATEAAVRIARGVTGRNRIASYGYHGASVSFAHKPDYKGQPQENVDLLWEFPWDDVEIVKTFSSMVSCVIVEVPALDDDAAIGAFLHECRAACDDYGIPLILDETVTGFRFGLAGACERYGVKPDLVCLGKAMCAIGGQSAVIGRRDLVDLLDQGVFMSTTFGGDPFHSAVSAATIRWLQEHELEVYGEIKPSGIRVGNGHLAYIGTQLKDGLNAIGVPVIGQPERSILHFDTDAEWLDFCSRMYDYNITMHRPQFPNLCHTDQDVINTLGAAEQVIKEMHDGD